MANNKAEPAMTLEQKRYYAAVARLEPAVSVNERFWQNGYRQGWLACSKDAIRAAQRGEMANNKSEWRIVLPSEVSDAEQCRKNGWTVGTWLVGDEGYGPTVIELTAIGRESIMAMRISHNGKLEEHPHEGNWTLSCRDWKKV